MAKTLAALMSAVVRRFRLMVRVAVSGRVESYDPATTSATIAPSVGEQDTFDGRPRDLAPASVQGVPVIMPGGALRGVTFGLEPNDGVVLVVRHRSHDEVDGGTEALPTVPSASRRMDMSDAVALPGYVAPASGRPAAQYRPDGQMVLYLPAGESVYIGTGSAALALARADLVDLQLGNLKVALNSWTPVAGDGGAALKVALSALIATGWPDSTACSRAKVDA